MYVNGEGMVERKCDDRRRDREGRKEKERKKRAERMKFLD